MGSNELIESKLYGIFSTTNQPDEDDYSTLAEIYFWMAVLWFFISIIGIRCHFLGYGESGDELSTEEYIHVALSSIVKSKTYKYRSKCNYFCYKQYLRYQMVGILKSQIAYILTMISLFELPHLDWSIIFAAIISCVIAFIAMVIRLVDLSMYYPLSKSVSSVAKQYTFDEKIIPYLVFEKISGHWMPYYMAFPTTCIGIYIIYIHNPSSSVTIKLLISISFSLLFALKRTYSDITFYYKTYSLHQVMADTHVFNAYNVYIEMKKLYDTNNVNNVTEYNPYEIVVNGLVVAGIVYFWMVSIMCSYQYYHDKLSGPFCDPKGIQNWLWITVVFSTIISLGICVWLTIIKSKIILPIFWTSLALLMIIFGSICVDEHGDHTNQYCGPTGFTGGVLLVTFGTTCYCCFWCLVVSAIFADQKHNVADNQPSDHEMNTGLLLAVGSEPKINNLEPSNAPVMHKNIQISVNN